MAINHRLALATAQNELGRNVREIQENWSPDIQRFLAAANIHSPAAWCAAFLVHCYAQAGGCPWADAASLAYVPHIYDWARVKGFWVGGDSSTVSPGDPVVFSDAIGPCHIGMVERVDGDYVHTIEGNTGPQGNTGEGDGLYRRRHRIDGGWVYGFIRLPDAAPKRRDVTVRLGGRVICRGDNRGGTVWAPVAALVAVFGYTATWVPAEQAVKIELKPSK